MVLALCIRSSRTLWSSLQLTGHLQPSLGVTGVTDEQCYTETARLPFYLSALSLKLVQLKTADPSYLLLLAPQLLGSSCTLEVQHYGYQILQRLVRLRLLNNNGSLNIV